MITTMTPTPAAGGTFTGRLLSQPVITGTGVSKSSATARSSLSKMLPMSITIISCRWHRTQLDLPRMMRSLHLRQIPRNALLAIALLMMSSLTMSQVQIEIAFPNLKFQKPVDLQHPSDGSDRLFVVEKQGTIYLFENDPEVLEKRLFLNITDRVSDDAPETGLLGFAFHPDYINNGYFYVNYTHKASPTDVLTTVISRFEVSSTDSNAAEVESEFIIMQIEQPHEHHNGGQIVFGPDGYLYIGMGDGGKWQNGQDSTTLLGAMLRIDIDNPQPGLAYGIPEDNPFFDGTAAKEVFAYGFRNPWRFSFDAITGSLWLGDVGHVRYEEIDIVLAGHNYGWHIMEGAHCYNQNSPSAPYSGCDTTGLAMPIWEYGRTSGEAVVGGFVYRGALVPSLYGKYVYGDFEFGTIWVLDYGVDSPTNRELFDLGDWTVTSFGVDRDNELYICSFAGDIYRMKELSFTVSVEERSPLPEQFNLYQNHPNPFNPATTIRYDLPEAGDVSLIIYDIMGREVSVSVDSWREAGRREVLWDGTDDAGQPVSAGVYLYQIQAGKFTQTRKILLLK